MATPVVGANIVVTNQKNGVLNITKSLLHLDFVIYGGGEISDTSRCLVIELISVTACNLCMLAYKVMEHDQEHVRYPWVPFFMNLIPAKKDFPVRQI